MNQYSAESLQSQRQNIDKDLTSDKFIFNIDRGGTFTDFYVQKIQILSNQQFNNSNSQKIEAENFSKKELYKIQNQYVFKYPSQSSLGQGPIVGIRNFLIEQKIMKESDNQIPTKNIFRINLGTTIATNALLQRKGTKNCMILTKGFKDLLTMRHLARSNIFDLKCERKAPLFTQIIEADQRVYLKEPPPELKAEKIYNELKSKQIYRKQISQTQISRICQEIKAKGFDNVGISFCHSLNDNINQLKLKKALLQQKIGFIEDSCGLEQLGYLKRSQTTNLNVFLGPIMKNYFQTFVNHFQISEEQEGTQGILNLKIMKSDGGFSTFQSTKPSQILLSGPAGGLIGYSNMVDLFQQISGLQIKSTFLSRQLDIIGLDMGGTSTDISRTENRELNIHQTTQIQSVFVCSPHLQIDTIAAGGGSKLYYENGLFKVGPQSVGSNPGPVCYGTGSELALTDANYLLGRIDSTYFPKIFGKNQNQGLNLDLTKSAFQTISQQINKAQENSQYILKSTEQIAEGFINIANQLMAKSARKFFTFGNPDAFVIFGSAGGQHCCDLAQSLDIHNMFIHRYSGVLSAYGFSKAPQTVQKKVYLGKKTTKQQFNYKQFIQEIEKQVKLKQQQFNFKQNYDERKLYVLIGYVGTNYQIDIQLGQQNIFEELQKKHMKINGFLLPGKQYRIQYLRIKYFKYPIQYQTQKSVPSTENMQQFKTKDDKVFFQGKWNLISFYDITNVIKAEVQGPAMLISKTATIFLKPNWKAFIQNNCVYLKRNIIDQKSNIEQKLKQKTNKAENNVEQNFNACDPIILTLYSTRLMSIAEQMGKVLQRISISTNIKERLDFSCGIFDWDGKVLANAPHIPVHLGSMETAVKQQIKRGIKSGQCILTNHPIAGGSHLPDLTVVSCIQIQQGFKMFVASRGHHADIGGISPGSMPPFSKYLQEQGLAVQKYQLTTQSDQFKEVETRQLFKHSRKINDNISDLLAQIAANKIGIKLLTRFVKEQTVTRFKRYVGYICKNAQTCVQKLLFDFSLKNNFKQVDYVQNSEFMDDGTELKLKLTIDRSNKKAIFDFTGTGLQILGNTNAPYSITRSAIIYSLRSLIGKDIPLNSGCLQPIQIIVPQGTILSPSQNSAVVGGNVETSQRIVDLILKPFGVVAASQGTMNNFLFGNQNISYYETIAGGSGAGEGFDGKTCQVHMTNTRITDVEHVEYKFPVILNQFGIRPDSGGSGKYKGGNGVIRQFIFLEPLEVSILSQRRVFNPYGLFGGLPGSRGKNLLIKKQQNKRTIRSLASKSMVNVQKFDIIRIETPGGGGYGKQSHDNNDDQ